MPVLMKRSAKESCSHETESQSALVVGIQGLDTEEVELGGSPEFWELLTGRRRHRTITRAQVEERIRLSEKSKPTTEHAVSPHTSGRKKASRRRG